ncbi:hypothetical protein CVS40_6606 [Lucilia cuprina]|nr:hypothetical protein CVS40_6606 [Lucilia cuprina]
MQTSSREKEETVFHLICECPTLAAKGNHFLGSYFISNLGDTECQNIITSKRTLTLHRFDIFQKRSPTATRSPTDPRFMTGRLKYEFIKNAEDFVHSHREYAVVLV